MIRIRCDETVLADLKDKHVSAIRSYISSQNTAYQESLYAAISALQSLPPVEYSTYTQAAAADDWRWLTRLILADVKTLRALTQQEQPQLQFRQFSDMYSAQFSRAPNVYLNKDSKYNAYKLIEGLGLHICPFCDEESAEIFHTDNAQRRNAQLDHFFPKGQYPALAMCFFNLVPSGSCNQIRLEKPLGKNPYEEDIESGTRLFPDVAIGKNLDTLSPGDCRIDFHASPEMTQNIQVLGLEDRYVKYQVDAHRLLRKVQMYNRMKQRELLRDFCPTDSEAQELFDLLDLNFPGEQEWGKRPLTKLRYDILSTVFGNMK